MEIVTASSINGSLAICLSSMLVVIKALCRMGLTIARNESILRGLTFSHGYGHGAHEPNASDFFYAILGLKPPS